LRDYGHEGQLGLEATPEEYVKNMTDVFREVGRVLKPEGTLWLNLGDSYVTQHPTGTKDDDTGWKHGQLSKGYQARSGGVGNGRKVKDIAGIPWRTAFALQADGWWLRQDIIWHKPNPMPESVTDRCTKAHEYIFLLTKSAKYYYDNEAIKEKGKVKYTSKSFIPSSKKDKKSLNDTCATGASENNRSNKLISSSNKRSVWTVTTKPYKEAHFATYPPDLITPCILAGCPEGGIVLDPFMGSGTTALVALKHNRHYVGFELNPDYIELIEKRVAPWKHQSRLTGVV
jgi:DNA modification methylase